MVEKKRGAPEMSGWNQEAVDSNGDRGSGTGMDGSCRHRDRDQGQGLGVVQVGLQGQGAALARILGEA